VAESAKCRRCGAEIEVETLVCPYCGHRVNDEWKAEVRERRKKRRTTRNMIVAGGAVAIAMLIFLAWPRDPGKINDGSISASNSYIAQIGHGDDNVRVRINLPRSEKPADQIVLLSEVMQDVGRAVAGGASDTAGATTLVVETALPTVDRKGDESRYTTFRLKYAVAKLAAANYKSPPVTVLNLADKVQRERPRADAALKAYCSANAVPARDFCATANRNEDDPAFAPPAAG
jgi:ribosomal protein L37E